MGLRILSPSSLSECDEHAIVDLDRTGHDNYGPSPVAEREHAMYTFPKVLDNDRDVCAVRHEHVLPFDVRPRLSIKEIPLEVGAHFAPWVFHTFHVCPLRSRVRCADARLHLASRRVRLLTIAPVVKALTRSLFLEAVVLALVARTVLERLSHDSYLSFYAAIRSFTHSGPNPL